MWAHPHREGIEVARCTVGAADAGQWLASQGWYGRRKSAPPEPDPGATRPGPVDRQFTVPAPNVPLSPISPTCGLSTGAFVYTAFAIDAFAGRIVGWQCSGSKHTVFVESAIRQAASLRRMDGKPLTGSTIHHRMRALNTPLCDFQRPSCWLGQPSIGTVGTPTTTDKGLPAFVSPVALPNDDDNDDDDDGIDAADDDGIDAAELLPGIIGICDTPPAPQV